MHELSLAQSIIGIVENNVPLEKQNKIQKVQLQIGVLSGIEIDALNFSYDILKEDTEFSKSILEIEMISGEGSCNECLHTFEYNSYGTACPHCGSYNINILSGREMKIKGIALDTE
mgnify:CR=1 FL=1